jgi:hypothetical protein
MVALSQKAPVQADALPVAPQMSQIVLEMDVSNSVGDAVQNVDNYRLRKDLF